MIDHVAVPVRDFEASKAFYLKALAPLGMGLLRDFGPEQTGGDPTAGIGFAGKPFFWIRPGSPSEGMHLAFAAENRAQVDAFHAAALAAGARDNGAPGLRPQYHPGYYGAFVIDPNGYNLEAVTHRPE